MGVLRIASAVLRNHQQKSDRGLLEETDCRAWSNITPKGS